MQNLSKEFFQLEDTYLKTFKVVHKETNLLIRTKKNYINKVKRFLYHLRQPLENFIRENPYFYSSLVPISPKSFMPEIVKNLCHVTEKVGVGPMAAVAGIISDYIGKYLLNYTDEVIVENGGDIFLKLNRPSKIGIYVGEKSPFKNRVILEINTENQILGICTSSGTVGHSFSFGKADAVVIVSDSASFSDALATATSNLVKSENDLEIAVNYAKNFGETHFVSIIKGNKIIFWSRHPNISITNPTA